MGRSAMLSNGSLMVGLNEHGLVHDFYYPYVGLENLTTARSVHHMMGIWVDNQFSWIDNPNEWDIHVEYGPDALVAKCEMVNYMMGIKINTIDFVDSGVDAFIRNITITNLGYQRREIRLFMHQVFEISRGGRADTALYVPDENYIFDYKGRCALLVYGRNQTTSAEFDQYAIGNYGIEGKQGTFIDAEDGQLSNSPVEHGGVDSVIRFSEVLDSKASIDIDYWIVAASSQTDAERLHNVIKRDGALVRLKRTQAHWSDWFEVGKASLDKVDPKYLPHVKRSMLVAKAHMDKRGGILASGDSSIYNYGRDYYSYVWPRDGALTLWPFIRMGYVHEVRGFFQFCADTMHPDGYLMHKYQPDRAVGSTWHPLVHGKRKELAIQEDETAIVVCMISEYYGYSKDEDFVDKMYKNFVKPSADFMASFIDEATGLPHASYDLWEERFGTHTYTTSVVYAALMAAGKLAEHFGNEVDAEKWKTAGRLIHRNFAKLFSAENQSYRKSILLNQDGTITNDDCVDMASMYGMMVFGEEDINNMALQQTAATCATRLFNCTPSGGAVRYEHDNYFLKKQNYLGNPWIVTTLWLAQYHGALGDKTRAFEIVDWCISTANYSGVISEQVDPDTKTPIGVAPLVWSHAELANTILYLSI